MLLSCSTMHSSEHSCQHTIVTIMLTMHTLLKINVADRRVTNHLLHNDLCISQNWSAQSSQTRLLLSPAAVDRTKETVGRRESSLARARAQTILHIIAGLWILLRGPRFAAQWADYSAVRALLAIKIDSAVFRHSLSCLIRKAKHVWSR